MAHVTARMTGLNEVDVAVEEVHIAVLEVEVQDVISNFY